MDRLGTEGAFEVLARARALEATGRSIIHLEVGEPDFATPDNIVEAAVGAIRAGETHYTPAAGLLRPREAVAEFVARNTGVATSADEVVLTPGSKNVFQFAVLALVEPGDEVIVPDPGYPIYRSLVEFFGGVAVGLPLRERNDFRVDVEELAGLVTPRTRMIVINTPHNPTGGALTPADVEAVAELAQRHDLWVVSDEIYSQILYEGEHASIYAVPGMKQRTILMDGLSKAYAMCGWRLGYSVAPAELSRRFAQLMINSSSCAASFTQLAAVEALLGADSPAAVAAMVAEFRRRRDVVVDGLGAIPGVRCHRPAGAFYAFPNVEGTGIPARDLAERLLTEGGVALLPGTAFGAQGEGFLRLSYANSVDNLLEAVRRIGDLVGATQPA
ncbi:MAG: pyridoxal phosphate-dependent aminotransferase [Candidatus Dormibacteria bacterium]